MLDSRLLQQGFMSWLRPHRSTQDAAAAFVHAYTTYAGTSQGSVIHCVPAGLAVASLTASTTAAFNSESSSQFISTLADGFNTFWVASIAAFPSAILIVASDGVPGLKSALTQDATRGMRGANTSAVAQLYASALDNYTRTVIVYPPIGTNPDTLR